MSATLLQGRLVVRRDRFTLDVDLDLAAGERIAVIGRNGHGKSTLADALVGLAEPTADSTITLAGAPLTTLPPDRRRVGYLAQDGLLFPHLSALDNVAFARTAGGGRRARRHADGEAMALLEAMGVAGRARAHPRELSGGEQQRVALARALATRPQLLVLDEPFAALDVEAAVQLRDLVAAFVRERGIALLLISHRLDDVAQLTERVLVLDHGRIAERLTLAELRDQPRHPFARAFAGLPQA